MDIRQVRHVVRAAAAITDKTVFVVIGSQAALVQFASLPAAMTHSMELDIYPRDDPGLAELIEGSIGRDSMFHEQFGYYADAVGPETARLPSDWEARAVHMTGDADGREVRVMAPEIHDLAVAKLLAGRDLDLEWIAAGADAKVISLNTVLARLPLASTMPEEHELATERIRRLMASGTGT
jgi:hypothetical protein